MNKKSLVTKSVKRLLILGLALLIGITVVSGLQFYNKMQEAYGSTAEAYSLMIDAQTDSNKLRSIIDHKEELSQIDVDSVDINSIPEDLLPIYMEWNRINIFINSTFYYNDNFTGFQIVIPDGDSFTSVWHVSLDDHSASNPMTNQEFSDLESAVLRSIFNAENYNSIILHDDLFIHKRGDKTLGTLINVTLDDNNNVIAVSELDIDISQIISSILQLILIIGFFIIFTLAFALNIYFYYTRREVMRPILQLEDAAKNVVEKLKRNEDTQRLNIHTDDEIESLSHSFESMEENLRNYIIENNKITAEQEHIKAELDLATGIQSDMLIKEFPPFPDRKEFDIYASMDPAKEVGGDFYDFFLIDDNQLALVIADVSGKGVPAALFMMRTMLMIESLATSTNSPSKILEKLNKLICKNNESRMFVTVWLGILDINTGILKASNAGHEFPIIKEPSKEFELYKDNHSFIIGGKKNTKFKEYELKLQPGSKLFLYTDGVPEAKNHKGERFQIEPTVNSLNKNPDASVSELIENVTKSVSEFVSDAEQFDDLTMLCIEYKGNN